MIESLSKVPLIFIVLDLITYASPTIMLIIVKFSFKWLKTIRRRLKWLTKSKPISVLKTTIRFSVLKRMLMKAKLRMLIDALQYDSILTKTKLKVLSSIIKAPNRSSTKSLMLIPPSSTSRVGIVMTATDRTSRFWRERPPVVNNNINMLMARMSMSLNIFSGSSSVGPWHRATRFSIACHY
jgi:hypothetical protein